MTLQQLINPLPETRRKVFQWITKNNGTQVEDLGDFITAYFPLKTIETSLNCKFEELSIFFFKIKIKIF